MRVKLGATPWFYGPGEPGGQRFVLNLHTLRQLVNLRFEKSVPYTLFVTGPLRSVGLSDGAFLSLLPDGELPAPEAWACGTGTAQV